MKVRLVIEGNVQGAGYRAMIKNVARRLKIKGLARNLDDGNVEVFCECDEKTLNKFIGVIDRKGDPEQPFSLNVEKINIYKEDDVNYVGLPEKFGYFHIDYLNEDLLKTSVERAEIGIFAFKEMHKDLKKGQDKMIEKQDETITAIKGLDKKQDKMIEKQDETVTAIKGLDKKQDTTIDVLKDFRDYTKQSFTDMGNRYGSIQDELVNTRKELAKLVEHIGVLVEEHIKRK